MQYKIPQNVDVEDKIFGPFSLRQFSWLVIGGFLTFVLYLTVARLNFFLFIVMALPIVAVFGALAFWRINERPFELFIVSAYRGLLRPRRRVWLRIPQLEGIVITPQPFIASGPAYKPGLQEVRSQLEELTMVVDTRGWGRPTESTLEFTQERIVSAPEEPAVAPEPEPDDPVETPTADLDKALEEAGRAAVARLKTRASHARTITPDDPSKRAYEQEVEHRRNPEPAEGSKQEVTPPVARYGSPEEMRAAIQGFQGGGA